MRFPVIFSPEAVLAEPRAHHDEATESCSHAHVGEVVSDNCLHVREARCSRWSSFQFESVVEEGAFADAAAGEGILEVGDEFHSLLNFLTLVQILQLINFLLGNLIFTSSAIFQVFEAKLEGLVCLNIEKFHLGNDVFQSIKALI